MTGIPEGKGEGPSEREAGRVMGKRDGPIENKYRKGKGRNRAKQRSPRTSKKVRECP